MSDDKPSRALHDNGNKHKGNVQKFLRNLEKKDREEKIEKEMVMQTLREVEEKARKQYAADVGDPSLAAAGPSSVRRPYFDKGPKSGDKRSHGDAGLEDGSDDEGGGDGEDEHPDFDPNFDYNSLWTQPEIPAKPVEVVKSTDAYGDWTVVEPEVAPVVVTAPKAAPGSAADWFEKKNVRHVRAENAISGSDRAFATSIDLGGQEERDPDDLRNFAVVERRIDTVDDDEAELPTIRARGGRGSGPALGGGGWTNPADVKTEAKEEINVNDEVKDEAKVKVEGAEDVKATPAQEGDSQPSLFKKRKVAGGNLRKK